MSTMPPTPGPPSWEARPQLAAPGLQPPTPPEPVRRRAISPLLTGIIGGLVGAGLTTAILLPLTLGGGTAATSPGAAPQSDILTAAAEACGSPTGVTVEDDGVTLTFDHRGEDEVTGGDIIDIMCVFTELDMPSRISTHMGQTTSLDGRQSAEWDELEIQWSYHPDRGMDGIVTAVAD